MSVETGPMTKSGPMPVTTLDEPWFMVGWIVDSKDHALADIETLRRLCESFEHGQFAKQRIRLFVIGREGEQGYREGVELKTSELDQIGEVIAELEEYRLGSADVQIVEDSR